LPEAFLLAVTPAPVTIRSARGADLDAIRALLAASALPVDGLDEQFGDGYAVAVSGEAIVGVEGIEVYGHHGLLRSAAIAPTWRGQGLGDALTRDRIAWSRRHGLAALYLLTDTADAYFPRFGFKAVSRDLAPDGIRASREFASACPASAIFMYLPLGTEN
jgi:amino-acid N-acetyltransferase